MTRISSNMPTDNMQYHSRIREQQLSRLQSSMAAQTRILNLRDDPTAAAHSTRYQSQISRLERFTSNIQNATMNHRVTEGHMRAAVDVMHRARELAVTGAHGTFSPDDKKLMAGELDELLGELVEIANAKNGDGNFIFAGERTRTTPFRTITGNVAGASGHVVTHVEYIGDIGVKQTEVSDGSYMSLNHPGNRVFWAENQQIFAANDALAYQVNDDASIMINTTQVDIAAGDNVYSIIAKINDSAAGVKARLDPVTNGLILETTTPHQVWLQDTSGTVLQDLGLVRDAESRPPANLAAGAQAFGGSLFDVVIRLRDELYAGNSINIGGSALRGIDDAMSNILSELGSLGAQSARLEHAYRRVDAQIPIMTEWNSKITDIDLAEATMELRMLEFTHRAALSVAARVIQPSLLDFLR